MAAPRPPRAPDRASPSPTGSAHALPPSAHLTPRIARGDRAAFAAFYTAWFAPSVGLAMKATGRDEAFCLDVVQDAMLRVVRSVRPMESDEDVRRWMRRVVLSTAIDHLRAERRARSREASARRGAGEQGADRDRVEWLRRELASCDGRDRSLVLLRFFRGLTLHASAGPEGLTEDAAHGRLRRVLDRLRKAWKD